MYHEKKTHKITAVIFKLKTFKTELSYLKIKGEKKQKYIIKIQK